MTATESAAAADTAPLIHEVKALEYNLCSESQRLYRRYNRPQLWRVNVWVRGREPDGRESLDETDLIPSAPVAASHLARLSAGHVMAMQAGYAEVYDAGVTLFRLDRQNYERLRAAHDDIDEIAV